MLTAEERLRFAHYCREEAASYSGLCEQAEKIPGMGPLLEHHRRYAVAYRIVADHLESVQEFTVGALREGKR